MKADLYNEFACTENLNQENHQSFEKSNALKTYPVSPGGGGGENDH